MRAPAAERLRALRGEAVEPPRGRERATGGCWTCVSRRGGFLARAFTLLAFAILHKALKNGIRFGRMFFSPVLLGTLDERGGLSHASQGRHVSGPVAPCTPCQCPSCLSDT